MDNNINNEIFFKYISDELKEIISEMETNSSSDVILSEIPIEMFLLTALANKNSKIYQVLDTFLTSVSFDYLNGVFYNEIMNKNMSSIHPNRKVIYTDALTSLLTDSITERVKEDDEIYTTHVLLGLLNPNHKKYDKIRMIFEKQNVNYETFKKMCTSNNQSSDIITIADDPITSAIRNAYKINGNTNMQIPSNIQVIQVDCTNPQQIKLQQAKKTNTADIEYCTNLNTEAINHKINDIICRDNEIKSISKILNRKRNNNVILVGDSGVGKTAIVEGIACQIANGTCIPSLFNYTILKLNTDELMAGTTLRGMFESRVVNLTKTLSKRENTILFIDDIHKILSSKKENDFDFSSLILNILKEGNIHVICTCSYDGYKKTFDQASELETYFQRVDVLPPSDDDCFKIVNYIKKQYESFHNVKYSEDIIKLIINLSKRYITYRTLPRSAIDIMDECGALKQILSAETKHYSEVKIELEQALEENNIDKSKELKLQLAKLLNEKNTLETVDITDEDVYLCVSEATSIPTSKLSVNDKERLIQIEDKLKQVVIGQDEACHKIAMSIKRNKIGLARKNKPISSFLTVGNTGVGKTLMAKTIAKEIFGDEKYLVRFDMSEYSDKTSVNKLIGTSYGYVGFEKGGLLTEAIKNKKYCVLLIDEIEKANDEIFNLFLQILDDGILTDNLGKITNFSNVIIIMTSNIGAKNSSEAHSFGFNGDDSETRKEVIKKELNNKFPPEFINRFDDIIFFNNLSKDDLYKIIDIELQKLNSNLKEIGFDFEYDGDVIDFIYKTIQNDSKYGARPIERSIKTNIENKITELILENEYNNHTFRCMINDNKLDIL